MEFPGLEDLRPQGRFGFWQEENEKSHHLADKHCVLKGAKKLKLKYNETSHQVAVQRLFNFPKFIQ
jgi:hypothetical protein